MTNWTARARTEILQKPQVCTAKTAKTQLSSVSSVAVWALIEKEGLAQDLYEAAMTLCDAYGDGIDARADMVRDIEATPVHLHAELLDYLRARVKEVKPC